jgi:hypothetical protein
MRPSRDAAYLGHRIPGATGPRLVPWSRPGSQAAARINHRGQGPRLLTMEPSGLESSGSLRPLEMIDLCETNTLYLGVRVGVNPCV